MDKPFISQNLKLLLAHYDVRAMDLARAAGVPQPTIHRIISGKTPKPHKNTIKAIAEYFSISKEQLIGSEPITKLKKSGLLSNILPHNQKIPVINWEEAADWSRIKTTYTADQTIVCDAKLGDFPFALVMNDSSMEPLFDKGTTLIIDTNKQPYDRCYAIVKLKEQQRVIFRQVLIDNYNHYLKPLSPNLDRFNTTKLDAGDSYIGILIQARRDFEEI